MLGKRVDPDVDGCVKFFPGSPPSRGEVILVNGQPVRVTRCKVRWVGLDWRITCLRVRPEARRDA